ncbi:caspase-8 isoform X4 [Arapaima gigas]
MSEASFVTSVASGSECSSDLRRGGRNMDFTTVLHKVSDELDSNEIAALKFLCKDVIQRKKLEAVHDCRDLFLRLEDRGLLDDVSNVAELLLIIKRYDLLRHLGTSRQETEHRLQRGGGSIVSNYRKLLYEVSEDVTTDNLEAIKFLLKLPRAKLDPCKNFLEVLVEMEKMELLAEERLGRLIEVLQKCNPQLASKVQDYQVYRAGEKAGSWWRPKCLTALYPETFHVLILSLQSRLSCILIVRNYCHSSRQNSIQSYNQVYRMSRRPRGRCLIINNFNFEKARKNNRSMGDRKGTDIDARELDAVFTLLHFEVTEYKDLTAEELLKKLKEYGKMDHSHLDAFVCCILSHGEKSLVIGTDGEGVPIRHITQPFTSSLCPSLAGKPKMFFIQACQGQNKQMGAVIQADGEGNNYEMDAGYIQRDVIPDDSDFLLGMATVEDYQSFRNTKEGSIFIQELCRQLREGCPRNENILNILTKVNREVSSGRYMNFRQMPQPRYTLTKTLILPVN